MIGNQHDKPTLENVYRTKSGRTFKKLKRYLDEMWFDLYLTSEHIINNPKRYVNEMWYGIVEGTYWRSVIWYEFNNFCVLESIST